MNTLNEVIVPPAGMSYKLAAQLVNDHMGFAHMWLCHGGDATKCPDGCEGSPTCDNYDERVKMYNNIHVWFTQSHLSAYKRGYDDARYDKHPLFWQVRDGGLRSDGEYDPEVWDDERIQAYIDGYNKGMK